MFSFNIVCIISTNDINSATSTATPPPALKETQSYNLQSREHILRGMWTNEASTDFFPQRFELTRTLSPD